MLKIEKLEILNECSSVGIQITKKEVPKYFINLLDTLIIMS